jgi:hypothetical protein
MSDSGCCWALAWSFRGAVERDLHPLLLDVSCRKQEGRVYKSSYSSAHFNLGAGHFNVEAANLQHDNGCCWTLALSTGGADDERNTRPLRVILSCRWQLRVC